MDKVNETLGYPSAKRLIISTIFIISVRGLRKYFKRAGVLKNKSRTVICVPSRAAASSCPFLLPPLKVALTPIAPLVAVKIST